MNTNLERRLGLLNATSINMSNMVGSGTFVTLPLMLGAMGGPQALLGWLVGAMIALSDGLVWSELAAALPGSGGTYVYLREAFGRHRWGRFWAFLFVFQMVSSGPLEIASGNIAMAQYVGYLWQGMSPFEGKLVAAGIGVLSTALLYRKITSIARLMLALWIGMLVSVGWVILTGISNFNPELAFSFPPNAFSFSTGFFLGLGSTTLYVMYCYLGYYGVCYLGDEVVDPPRTIPRAVIISVVAVMAINLLFCLSIVGVVPWREVMQSQYMVCEFMQRIYGNWAGIVACLLMLWTSFAGIYALTLTYSRIPYAAALDGNFWRVFAALHPKKGFPHVSLLLIGGLSAAASFFNLAEVINALITSRILVQFVGQIVALWWLRSYHPEVVRPFQMALYPLPSAVALFGWMFVFLSAGYRYIAYGLLTVLAGCAVFLISAKRNQSWPFAIPGQPALLTREKETR
ncbi:MAG: amino acid permease [Acidobacteria bacterium]|nr:amino acid permease [Acidobacteriota bacterium]